MATWRDDRSVDNITYFREQINVYSRTCFEWPPTVYGHFFCVGSYISSLFYSQPINCGTQTLFRQFAWPKAQNCIQVHDYTGHYVGSQVGQPIFMGKGDIRLEYWDLGQTGNFYDVGRVQTSVLGLGGLKVRLNWPLYWVSSVRHIFMATDTKLYTCMFKKGCYFFYLA